MSIDNYVSILSSISALIISIIALIYTIKTYLLKQGVDIRGSYSMCSSMVCDDKYVGTIVLENLKDRSITIFKIYLKVGYNYFVEVDDFENNPLILEPFKVFKKEYDPIDLYSSNTDKIIMNNLFDSKRVKKRIILSTSYGVKWTPLSRQFFSIFIVRSINMYSSKLSNNI